MARVWTFGDDIDTDQMVPGRYAPIVTGDDNTGKYCFIFRVYFQECFSHLVAGQDAVFFYLGEGNLAGV